MPLADVHHQEHARRVIQRALSSDRLPHAYLFFGPDGVGKELLARGLAELLLCEALRTIDPPDDQSPPLRVPCGTCSDCRMVAAQTHPDLHLIHRYLIREHPDADVRRRKGLDIGVDVVRHFIIDKVGFTPARGRAKVFIIREADRITTAAQNALLKTLEEPPGPTFLILLASNLDRLLPTTRSRCQPVRFDSLPSSFVRDKLDEMCGQHDEAARQWAARVCDGSLGRAMAAMNDGLFEINERVIETLSNRNGGDQPLAELITNEAKDLGKAHRTRDPDISDTEALRRGIATMLRLIADWYGDLLRIAAGGDQPLVNEHHSKELAASATARPGAYIDAISRIAAAERQLDRNANTQLVIEVLLADVRRILTGAGRTSRRAG